MPQRVRLKKATSADAGVLHALQVAAFTPLLERYGDVDTSPAREPLEKTLARLEDPATDYYVILQGEVPVGGVRVVSQEKGRRISPIFLTPACQGKGTGRAAMLQLEALYPETERWTLETILQEERLCRFYESLGYRATGEETVLKEKMTLVHYEKNRKCQEVKG